MNNKHEITAKVSGEKWQTALTKSFNKNVKEVKMDGFRKGKVPRDVYEKKFGTESLFMDAVNDVLPEISQETIEKSGLTPVIQPLVDIKDINKEGVEFIFTIITKPEVKIKQYKNLKVEKPEVKVTTKDVEASIEELRKTYAEIVVKDGQIEQGDTAIIDFEGFNNGEPFAGGKGENVSLEIGSKTFIPGFEEQLIGVKANEEREIKVTFPENYPSEELKGKEVLFKVKVNEVKTKVIPDLNADFYADLGIDNVNNEESLFKHVQTDLETKKQKEAESTFIDNVLAAVAGETTIDIPEELVTAEIERMVNQFEERIKMQGATLEQYCQITGTSKEEFAEQLRDEAMQNLRYRFIIEEVANLEKVEISEEEAQAQAKTLATNYQTTEEELIKAFGGLEMIKYDLKMQKALGILKDNN